MVSVAVIPVGACVGVFTVALGDIVEVELGVADLVLTGKPIVTVRLGFVVAVKDGVGVRDAYTPGGLVAVAVAVTLGFAVGLEAVAVISSADVVRVMTSVADRSGVGVIEGSVPCHN